MILQETYQNNVKMEEHESVTIWYNNPKKIDCNTCVV